MKTTKVIQKTGFLENQILRFKASKNRVFVLTVVATLMVFVKWISSIFYSDMQQRTMRSMLALMLTNSGLKMQLQNGS